MNTKASTPRGNTLWTLRRIRGGVFAAAFGLLGLASPAVAQSTGRAAILLPPQPVSDVDIRTVARGAIDDGPGEPLSTSPVPRKAGAKPATTGPTWLNGSDPTIKPASAQSPFSNTDRATPFFGRIETGSANLVSPKAPSMFDRGMDKLRTVFTSESSTPKPSSVPSMAPRSFTVPRELWDLSPREVMAREQAPREMPSAASPLQSVTPTGNTVLAGPPAYRWYGYGTTTPGANPYSPSGQYPRASANWYSLTGATPGAFPVPVSSGDGSSVGTEPPAYRPPAITRVSTLPPESVGRMAFTPSSPPSFTPAPIAPTPTAPMFTTPPVLTPPSVSMTLAPHSFTSATPSVTPPPMLMPTPPMLTPPPSLPLIPPAPIAVTPMPVSTPKLPVLNPVPMPMPVPPVPMPALPPVPTSRAQPSPATTPPLLPKLPDGRAISATPPKLIRTSGQASTFAALPRIPELPPPIPVMPTTAPAAPASLPTLLVTPIAPTRPAALKAEEQPWQSVPAAKDMGEGWTPADGLPRTQSRAPQGSELDVQWRIQPITQNKTLVVRGQAPEEPRADPISGLVQSLLRGRAEGIDIRWNGERRLMVCFETTSAREASQIVHDLSARPELAPLQVDFCVVVK